LKLLEQNPRPIGIQILSNDDGNRIRIGKYPDNIVSSLCK